MGSVRHSFLLLAALCGVASSRAATPIGIGEFKSTVPGVSAQGIADVVLTDVVSLVGDQEFLKCPMVVVATGKARAAVEAERELQKSRYFDPASRARGKLIDPVYLVDGEVAASGTTATWTLKFRHTQTGQTFATSTYSGTLDGLFTDSEGAGRAILREACKKLPPGGAEPPGPIGSGTITMTARFDYTGRKARDTATTKERMTFGLEGQIILELVAKTITVSQADDGATQYFVAGPLYGSRIAKWRMGNDRTGDCLTARLETQGTVIGTHDEPNSFFIVTVRKIGGRDVVTVEPPPWIAVNADPKGQETTTDRIVHCRNRPPETSSETRDVEGPILEAKSLDARGVEGVLAPGPGIKGEVVSKDRYVIPGSWWSRESAPEAAPVEVRIELDLSAKR